MAQGVCSAHVISLHSHVSSAVLAVPARSPRHLVPVCTFLAELFLVRNAGQAHFRTSGEEFGYLADPTHSTPTFASDAQRCQLANERGDAPTARMVKNVLVRATTTIEHDRERMTARGMMFNSGRESWSWRSSRKRPCAVDHATCLAQLTLVKMSESGTSPTHGPTWRRRVLTKSVRQGQNFTVANIATTHRSSSVMATTQNGSVTSMFRQKPNIKIQNFGLRLASNLLARLLICFASRVCAMETKDSCVVITPTCWSERTLFNTSRCATVNMLKQDVWKMNVNTMPNHLLHHVRNQLVLSSVPTHAPPPSHTCFSLFGEMLSWRESTMDTPAFHKTHIKLSAIGCGPMWPTSSTPCHSLTNENGGLPHGDTSAKDEKTSCACERNRILQQMLPTCRIAPAKNSASWAWNEVVQSGSWLAPSWNLLRNVAHLHELPQPSQTTPTRDPLGDLPLVVSSMWFTTSVLKNNVRDLRLGCRRCVTTKRCQLKCPCSSAPTHTCREWQTTDATSTSSSRVGKNEPLITSNTELL